MACFSAVMLHFIKMLTEHIKASPCGNDSVKSGTFAYLRGFNQQNPWKYPSYFLPFQFALSAAAAAGPAAKCIVNAIKHASRIWLKPFGTLSVFPLRIILIPFHSLIRLSLYPINYAPYPNGR